ncbi:MAG TPA: hypothetical protein VG125_18865 [Pirellulales bacterium]|jgi:hypothetical protein|nr:hypothetical protein [Pirellulales bacterium]
MKATGIAQSTVVRSRAGASPSMRHAPVAWFAAVQRLITFLVVSVPVFACWTVGVDSERDLGRDAEGQVLYDWSNFGRMVDGTAPAPFVRRRILPETTRLVLYLTPDGVWRTFEAWVHADSLGGQWVSRLFAHLNWRRDRYPQLVVGYLLIWLSLVGFMYSAAHFATVYYAMDQKLATAVGCLLGIGLLGGSGPGFAGYTYDIPNVFLFLLTLYAIVAGRCWMPAAFLAAVYSKETSCLLVLAYAMQRRRQVASTSYWLTLAWMSGVYVGVRTWVAMIWDNPPAADFWFPLRNLYALGESAICNCWYLAFAAVGFVRFYGRTWHDVPADLKWFLLLGVVLLCACFFKGIIEERRDYLEVYPIWALILFQWAMVEIGLKHLFVPRECNPRLQAPIA